MEDVLVKSCQEVISSFFHRLIERVQKAEYYSHLYRLLGNDAGIVEQIKALETLVQHSLMDAAKVECDRFVRESPRFYDEGTFSIYQFRQTLAQTSQGYDSETMVQAQPAIKQLLKLDFEPKVSETIRKNFRANINAVLKSRLLPLAEKQGNDILQQYNNARNHLEQTLEKEAEEKIAGNMRSQKEVESNIADYNQAVSGINDCLQAMQLHSHLLPVIADSDFKSVIVDAEALKEALAV